MVTAQAETNVADVAKAGLATMAGFARRLRAGDAPRLGVDGGDKPSPWAAAAIRLADGREIALGRTNTEYATDAPSFGANARAATSCPHAKPRAQFVAGENARLAVGGDLSPLGVAPVLERYLKQDDAVGASLVLRLSDERYSVAAGVSEAPLGERGARAALMAGSPNRHSWRAASPPARSSETTP